MTKVIRYFLLGIILLSLARAAVAQSEALTSSSSFEGQRIQEVLVICATSPELVKLIEKQLTFQAGEVFSQSMFRESIRNIYSLNRFSQVVVEGELVEGGVRISVCPVQIKTISKLEFSGNRAFPKSTLREIIGLDVGDGLPSMDPEYVTRPLVTFYREHGYRQVQVYAQITETPNGTGAILAISIQEGAPSKIGAIMFAGQTVFNEEELQKISSLRPGKTFTLDGLEEGIDRIREAYAKKSYFNVIVASQDVEYDVDSGLAEVSLTLEEGQSTIVRFEGNDQIPGNTLKKLIDINSENDLSEKALAGHVQTLVTWYREKGYHFIEASAERVEEQGNPVVVFTLREGPRVLVQHITIQGNEAVSTKALRQVMLTSTGGLFSRGWYQDAVFEEDLLAIKALYEQKGYLGARIVSVVKEFSLDQTEVSLTITVEEGVQTRIAEVRILGENDDVRFKKIQRLNVLKQGDPLTISKVNTTVSQIRNFYNNLGYLNANIDVSTAFNEDNSQVIVTLQLSAGQQFFIGNISVQGVVKTKKAFIMRELLVKEGDVYNPQKIRNTVRRLHQLGLYDSVTFRRLDSKSQNPKQDMLLLVSETSAKDVEFGIGYNSADKGIRGFVEYSDKNVFNYGGKGSVRTELSLELPKVTFQYVHPHLFTQDTRLVASLFDELQRDNPSFEVEKRGSRLAVQHTFDPTLSLSIGYFFQQVDPSNVKEAAQISPYDTDVLNLGGLDTQVIWDFRDDILQPRKGGVNQLYLLMTSKSLGAEAEFFEAQAQSNWYWRVFGDTVVACAFSGKIIEPANGSKQVPIYARYFLGGDNTVRGFKKHQIGPTAFDEDGNEARTGGNRLIRGNAEIRFPIYGPFGGVAFYDAGANWINEDGFTSEYIREGAGLGLRVETPIGPLRLDYGWKLDRENGESPGEFYFTIGSAF